MALALGATVASAQRRPVVRRRHRAVVGAGGVNRYAFFRDGTTAVILRTIDDEITAKEFKALAQAAERRAR